jgi:hypothetical protein
MRTIGTSLAEARRIAASCSRPGIEYTVKRVVVTTRTGEQGYHYYAALKR